VTLTDQTAAQTIGSSTITGGLAAGASTVLSYTWDTSTASTGAHTLGASHNLADDNAANDSRTTVVTVNGPVAVGLHFGDLDASSAKQGGSRWVGTVTVTAHGPNHEVLANADVGGLWFDNVEFTCTTNAQGQCTASRVFRNRVSSMNFLAVGIVFGLTPFTPEANHDPDGDSDGTIITVRKPQ
ncbi:MAG TPA: hypothetical protein VK864_03825, partial [Longimicrobiales bacterium]|nr:hypothetical protein [Longimicrobiales bacterium]